MNIIFTLDPQGSPDHTLRTSCWSGSKDGIHQKAEGSHTLGQDCRGEGGATREMELMLLRQPGCPSPSERAEHVQLRPEQPGFWLMWAISFMSLIWKMGREQFLSHKMDLARKSKSLCDEAFGVAVDVGGARHPQIFLGCLPMNSLINSLNDEVLGLFLKFQGGTWCLGIR